MDQNYMQIAIEGAFRLDPSVRTLEQLRARTDAVMLRPTFTIPNVPTTPEVSLLDETAEDDGIVISRELGREMLGALDHAAGFCAFIPRKFKDDSVGEWAGSVRFDAMHAAMRFRRAALAQERM